MKGPDIASASIADALVIVIYALVACSGVNDTLKVAMIRGRVSAAA